MSKSGKRLIKAARQMRTDLHVKEVDRTIMPDHPTPTLADLESKVRHANEAWIRAIEHEKEAASIAHAALTALNSAQRAFEARVAELRKAAACGSHWNREA